MMVLPRPRLWERDPGSTGSVPRSRCRQFGEVAAHRPGRPSPPAPPTQPADGGDGAAARGVDTAPLQAVQSIVDRAISAGHGDGSYARPARLLLSAV